MKLENKFMQFQSEPLVVQIWQIQAQVALEQQQALFNTLDDREQKQAQRLVNPLHQQRYIAVRGQVRAILAHHLTCQPQAIQFFRNAHGKPYLAPPDQPQPLYFNLSDSHQWALLAVCQQAEVGVDLEYRKLTIDYLGIAKRFFAQAEYQQLQALAVDEQPLGFYAGWTRKEAYIKLIGEGLSHPLDRFVVDLAMTSGSCLQQIDNSCVLAKQYDVRNVNLSVPYAAAVALRGQIAQISTHCWGQTLPIFLPAK